MKKGLCGWAGRFLAPEALLFSQAHVKDGRVQQMFRFKGLFQGGDCQKVSTLEKLTSHKNKWILKMFGNRLVEEHAHFL